MTLVGVGWCELYPIWTGQQVLPSTDFADDDVVRDAHAWSRALSSCWRPDRHTAGGRRQRTSGDAGGGRCCRAASAPRRAERACGSACPRQPGSSMKRVGLVGELVTPRASREDRSCPQVVVIGSHGDVCVGGAVQQRGNGTRLGDRALLGALADRSGSVRWAGAPLCKGSDRNAA